MLEKTCQISLIAAIDENYGLGINNQLLCYLPYDLQYFKKTTLGKPVIMGRKVFESIGKPLPGRRNIVVGHALCPTPGVELYRSLEEALMAAENHTEIMIIGGASIYEQTLSLATRIYLTLIRATLVADVFFPKIDMALWSCADIQFKQQDDKNQFAMTFFIFERIAGR